MHIRHTTIGSTAYTPNAIKNIPRGRIPTVLFRSLNKAGNVENFKGNADKTFMRMYNNSKFYNGVFVIGLWRDLHDFKGEDVPFILKLAKKLQSLYNGKPIYFMPFLEHTEDAETMKELFASIKNVAPNLFIVNNPANFGGRTGEYLQGHINELHYSAKPKGKKPDQGLMIYCFDGVNCADADFQKWRDEAEGSLMFGIWWAVYNVKNNSNESTPRPKRNSYPLPEHYRQAEYMLENPKKKTNFKKIELYKSNADRHKPGNQDPRADTPVFILTTNGKQVTVKDVKGNKIFSADNKGSYHDEDRWIYRPSVYKWPHQWAKFAVRRSGSSVCSVWLDGKKIGTVALAFRDGYPYKEL